MNKYIRRIWITDFSLDSPYGSQQGSEEGDSILDDAIWIFEFEFSQYDIKYK